MTETAAFRRMMMARVASLCAVAVLAVAAPAPAQEMPPPTRAAGLYGLALAQGRDGDWAAAARTAARAGAVAQALVEWQRLRSGAGDWRAVSAFAAAHPDWPDLARLRAQAEATLAGTAPPAAVTAFFADAPPATGAGAVALVVAQAALGQGAASEATALHAWRELTLSAAQEAALLAAHGAALAAADAERLDMLLWRRQAAAAERQAARMGGGWPALATARLALAARADGVNALIAAVPAAQAGDPGLAFERFDWRMHNRLHDSAAELILERSEAGRLGRPEAWARGRAFLARQALAAEDARLAYRLAAGHGMEAGAGFADMEWFAGFVALRFLDDPARALEHFRRLRLGVGTPISLSRAGYWEGRAHEALDDPANAEAAHAFAAEFQTTFYGQLSAERVGLATDPALAGAAAAEWRGQGFLDAPLLQAAHLLRGAGDWHAARRFFLQAAEGMAPDALAALAEYALALDEPNWAVNVARIAGGQGVELVRAGFPLTWLAEADLAAPAELVLAIARRESEFDPAVISPADARGLMQLLPATARRMAAQLGEAFEEGRLLSDPAQNARLGAAYLALLIDEFGPGLALVAAGYNAGPGRPRAWIGTLGDPRTMDADALIDWVERVPFAETRNYIMRVTESLIVYRARLGGVDGSPPVTEVLRGR